VLAFYARLAEFQRRLYAQFAPAGHDFSRAATASNQRALAAEGRDFSSFRAALDLAQLIPHFPDFLSLLQRIAPAPVAAAARGWASHSPTTWGEAFSGFWLAGTSRSPRDAAAVEPKFDPITDLICRAFLQPYAESIAANCIAPPQLSESAVCPLCSSLPLLGVLRPEGDGAKRHLVCSWCLHEWPFRRIFCPSCGEEAEPKLPVYVADQFPHIRVEACDTCHHYLRTIDLTKDGHAIPIVDDLAAIPLTLWAQEHNYIRLRPNLLNT
jgi:Protein involved in formate dehydrogenase formation